MLLPTLSWNIFNGFHNMSTDCNKTCSTGNLSDTCSVCECAGSAINGRVVYLDNNTTTLPLADVEVYVVGQEWEVWNTTDRTGRFRLTRRLICIIFSFNVLCWIPLFA